MRASSTARRATLRDVATEAGVSQMTVSRALGGRSRIADDTRRRILSIADRLGYRPDPEVAKLMVHLRGRRTRRFQSVLMGLTTRSADDREQYFRTLIAGARLQASSRGYGFDLMHLSPEPGGWAGVQRTLESRGVEGILLLPQQSPVDLTTLLAWPQFSVVAASASPTGPSVHRVMPHHFANTLLLCRTLATQGHRRIGLVIPAEHDVRSEHGFTAAVTWHGLNELQSHVPPLVAHEASPSGLRAWFARERPDVIITHELSSARDCARVLGRRLAGPPRFVVTSLTGPNPGRIAGIDERPAAIGAAAADLLASMVERRVRGHAASPASTLLTGIWSG